MPAIRGFGGGPLEAMSIASFILAGLAYEPRPDRAPWFELLKDQARSLMSPAKPSPVGWLREGQP